MAQVTPTKPAMVFPTTIFQGCAKGLAGTAKSNTEDAPIGAIYHALNPPSTYQLINDDTANPSSAPTPQTKRSFSGKTLKLGFKVFNHSSCV